MTSPTGMGILRAITSSCACVIRFQVPSDEIRIIEKRQNPQTRCVFPWTILMKLPVDRVVEVPDLPIGEWICNINVNFSGLLGSPQKVFATTEVIPPKGFVASRADVVHFSVTGQNFNDRGSAGNSPWVSRSDGIVPKTVAPDDIAQVQKNRSPWTYILAQQDIIKVELVFPIAPKSKGSSLPAQLWDGYAAGVHTDCLLVSRDGKQLPCHRFILATRSTVFAAMFEHDMQEKRSGVCKIDDVDDKVLQILLEFLYTDRAQFERIKDIVEDVYNAADKYAVEELCTACEKIMMDNLSVKTALGYLNFAVAHGLDGLKLRAIKFLNDNAGQI